MNIMISLGFNIDMARQQAKQGPTQQIKLQTHSELQDFYQKKIRNFNHVADSLIEGFDCCEVQGRDQFPTSEWFRIIPLTPGSSEVETVSFLKINKVSEIAGDGGNHPDPVRDYEEKKIRMKTAKALMTKKIKRLENAISDYEELKAMNVQNKDLVGAAKEIIECREAAKEAYKKIEDTNTKLEAKLIILDRKGEVPDVDKSMTELSEACQDYWEKWETVRTTNKMILMEADFTVKNIGTNSQVGSGSAPTEFIRFNPAPDTRPSFLERESQMLEVITWIEQVTYYVKTGFKN